MGWPGREKQPSRSCAPLPLHFYGIRREDDVGATRPPLRWNRSRRISRYAKAQLPTLLPRARKFLSYIPLRGVFSSNRAFLKDLAQLIPYELTHVQTTPRDCADGLSHQHARFESSEALAEQPAVARHRRRAAWMPRRKVACRGAPPPTY